MQPTNHFSLLSILSTSGWFGNGWLAVELWGPPFSLSCEKGTIEPQSVQSRAAPVSPSINNKNNHHKECKKRRGKRNCACLPLLGCI